MEGLEGRADARGLYIALDFPFAYSIRHTLRRFSWDHSLFLLLEWTHLAPLLFQHLPLRLLFIHLDLFIRIRKLVEKDIPDILYDMSA